MEGLQAGCFFVELMSGYNFTDPQICTLYLSTTRQSPHLNHIRWLKPCIHAVDFLSSIVIYTKANMIETHHIYQSHGKNQI